MRHRLLLNVIIVSACLHFPAIAFTQVQKIYAHPKTTANRKLAEIVDSVRFIPLESKEGIELSVYTNIQLTDQYFLILDNPGKFILVYTRAGRFVKKINYKKLGEGFYPGYYAVSNEIVFFGNNKNYALTTRDLVEIKLDVNNPRNKKYFKKYSINLNDSTFSIKKDIASENDIRHAYPLNDGYYWQGEISTSPLYEDSLDYELKIFQNNRLVKSYFPYNRINEPRFLYSQESASVAATDTPFIYYVTRPYCDTIYKMVKDSLFPLYQLVLPMENSLPPSFYKTAQKSKTDRENFQRNNGWMLRQIYNFYETPQFFFFTISYLSNYDSYIHQKQGNVTYRLKNIKSDSTLYDLSLLSQLGMSRNKGKFYKVEKAGDLISFFEQHKNYPVPNEIAEYLKANPGNASPVMVEFKIKNK